MASPSTYTELFDAIVALAEDDSDEFAEYVPTAIGLAEDRLFRELDYDFSSVQTLTTTITQNTLAKPTGHKLTHNLYITVGGEKTRLIKRTEDFISDYWPNASTTDIPKYYADRDDTTWLLAPTPNGSYTITAEVVIKPPYLSDSVATNKILTYAPDVLFYASMAACAEWMKDTEAQAIYEQKLQALNSTANNEGRRTRQDDNTKVNNPEGGRNTLTKNAT